MRASLAECYMNYKHATVFFLIRLEFFKLIQRDATQWLNTSHVFKCDAKSFHAVFNLTV